MSAESPAPRPTGWEPELAELELRTRLVQQMGGPEGVARQHSNGKLTVRGRGWTSSRTRARFANS